MRKTQKLSWGRKRVQVKRILKEILQRNRFLILGHQDSDDDCVASMVAFSLLLEKFNKMAHIVLSKQSQPNFPYLLNICKYNDIRVFGGAEDLKEDYDAVIVVDTPKPDMLDFRSKVQKLLDNPHVRVIEIDHHLEADSAYIGEPEYSLVDESSSTCELIGDLLIRLQRRKRLLKKYRIKELFTRNIVLAIITGIASDSKMGQFLRSSRERRSYHHFIRIFDRMLHQKTRKDSGNFESVESIFSEMNKLTEAEKECYQEFKKRKQSASYFSYIVLNGQDIQILQEKFDMEVIVAIARHFASSLAEESSHLSLVCYVDPQEVSEFVQFRIRRSQNFKDFDLRWILTELKIANGGGHEGAVGFRVPKSEVQDLDALVSRILTKTSAMITSMNS